MVVANQGQEMVVADHGQEMEVAEDDLAMVVPVLPKGGLAMVVVPDNDHAPGWHRPEAATLLSRVFDNGSLGSTT